MGPARRPWVKDPRAARCLDQFGRMLCWLSGTRSYLWLLWDALGLRFARYTLSILRSMGPRDSHQHSTLRYRLILPAQPPFVQPVGSA